MHSRWWCCCWKNALRAALRWNPHCCSSTVLHSGFVVRPRLYSRAPQAQIYFDYDFQMHDCGDVEVPEKLWEGIVQNVSQGTQPGRAVEVLREWKAGGNELTKEQAHKIVVKLLSRLWPIEALRVTTWLDRERMLNDMSNLLRLDLLCRCEHWPEAERKFNRLSNKTEEAYLVLVRNFAAKGTTRKLEVIMNEMEEAKVMTKPTAYALAFRTFLSMGDFHKAQQYFQDYEASGLGPDAGLLWHLCRSKHKFPAVDALGQAKQALEQLKLDRTNRREMLRLAAVVNKREGAENIWKQIKDAPPVLASEYVAALHTFNTVADVDKVEELSREFLEAAGEMTFEHADALQKMYSRRRMMDKAEAMYEKMHAMRPTLDGTPGYFIVKAYLAANDLDKARQWFDKTLSRGELGLQPASLLGDVVAELLTKYEKTGDVQGAEELVLTLPRLKTARAFNALLKVYRAAKVPAYGMEARMAALNVRKTEYTAKLLEQVALASAAVKPAGV